MWCLYAVLERLGINTFQEQKKNGFPSDIPRSPFQNQGTLPCAFDIEEPPWSMGIPGDVYSIIFVWGCDAHIGGVFVKKSENGYDYAYSDNNNSYHFFPPEQLQLNTLHKCSERRGTGFVRVEAKEWL